MTYSLGVKGARADNVAQAEVVAIEDSVVAGGATVTIPTPGGMQQAMRLNTQFLGQGPGGTVLYTLDAERSTPDVPILKPVG